MAVTISVGTRFPAYATSMGRVLLADLTEDEQRAYFARADLRRLTSSTTVDVDALRRELAEVRRRGWSLVDQELEEGLRSVAAPVRDRAGAAVAAVNLSAAANRWSLERMRSELVPPLLATATRIEADLAAGSSAVRAEERA
jgi:IclR family pca regulon transcriptional regulator